MAEENKKVLIITATCGDGHNSIAKSIEAQLTSEGAIVKKCDLYEKSQRVMRFYNDIYLWACKRVPHLYNLIWHIERKYIHDDITKSRQYRQIKGVIDYYKNIITEFQPTEIVCTHVAAGAVISYLKFTNFISDKITTFTVLHDYTLCPYWDTNRYNDYCLTPADFCEKDLLKVGFKKEQIISCGYPINKKFYTKADKKQTREKLGIEDKFTFMSVAGGNGLGVTVNFVKKILKTKGDYQLLVICGKNKKAKEKLEKFISKKKVSNVKIFGFVNNIEEMMSASDVAFTRGGANSLSECLYMDLPVIFRENLIINEAETRDIFVKLGCGTEIKRKRNIPKICEKFLKNPQMVETMKENIRKILKPNPVYKVCEVILNKQI